MKRLIAVLALLLVAAYVLAQAPPMSLSLPSRNVVHCHVTATAKTCTSPAMLTNDKVTGVIVALHGGNATITDNLGSTWTRDACTPGNGGDCIFHATLNTNIGYYSAFPDVVTVSPPPGSTSWDYNMMLLIYDGIYDLTASAVGNYADLTLLHTVPECADPANHCPYDWTWQMESDAGELIIAWGNSMNPKGSIAKAGEGYHIEGSDGILAVEDKIAPVDGIYSGSMSWFDLTGHNSANGHWEMGVAAYQRKGQQ